MIQGITKFKNLLCIMLKHLNAKIINIKKIHYASTAVSFRSVET